MFHIALYLPEVLVHWQFFTRLTICQYNNYSIC